MRRSLKRWNPKILATITKAGPYASLCFAKCIMNYGYSIASTCYDMNRSTMSYLLELSHLGDTTTLNHCLNFFINSCLVCLDPRVELMMGFSLLA